MDEKELIITTAKEILLKDMEKFHSAFIAQKDQDDKTAILGERFKTLALKVQEAFESLSLTSQLEDRLNEALRKKENQK